MHTRSADDRPSPLAVSPAEAAEMLSVTRNTVYAMAKRGEFTMRKLGSRTVIPFAELEAYVARAPSVFGSASSDPRSG